jgi:hypothetical protein
MWIKDIGSAFLLNCTIDRRMWTLVQALDPNQANAAYLDHPEGVLRKVI